MIEEEPGGALRVAPLGGAELKKGPASGPPGQRGGDAREGCVFHGERGRPEAGDREVSGDQDRGEQPDQHLVAEGQERRGRECREENPIGEADALPRERQTERRRVEEEIEGVRRPPEIGARPLDESRLHRALAVAEDRRERREPVRIQAGYQDRDGGDKEHAEAVGRAAQQGFDCVRAAHHPSEKKPAVTVCPEDRDRRQNP